jgi:hypothetical protein
VNYYKININASKTTALFCVSTHAYIRTTTTTTTL